MYSNFYNIMFCGCEQAVGKSYKAVVLSVANWWSKCLKKIWSFYKIQFVNIKATLNTRVYAHYFSEFYRSYLGFYPLNPQPLIKELKRINRFIYLRSTDER